MKTILLSFIFFISATTHSIALDTQKLKIVQTMIDSAKTQADLNLASKLLFNIWSSEVEKKELEVSKTMPKHLKIRFKKSMILWRRHVEHMSSIRSEMFKRDMMEPQYYKLRGIESKLQGMKRARRMQPYVYNMSMSIYYEEKWVELDVLLNSK